MDVLKHLQRLMGERKINVNQLAKKSNIAQSTLSGLFQRNNTPTIPTLERLCEGLGITMSEFFSPDGTLTTLTKDQRNLLDNWNTLSDQHKEAVLDLIKKL